VTLRQDRIDEPLHWRKPATIFVCSMGDLFHDDVPSGYRRQVWQTMTNAQHHTFLVLTKRADAMLHWYTTMWARPPLPNVWLGVTAENQAAADERIPALLLTPAAKRFVSCEPLLGQIGLFGLGLHRCQDPTCEEASCLWPQLDWIIAGGETGPGARPTHPQWGRSLLEQCKNAGVPFFWKSWGDWAPAYAGIHFVPLPNCSHFSSVAGGRNTLAFTDAEGRQDGFGAVHIGKKAAGRLLDGQEWNEKP
jgi:protein gp37